MWSRSSESSNSSKLRGLYRLCLLIALLSWTALPVAADVRHPSGDDPVVGVGRSDAPHGPSWQRAEPVWLDLGWLELGKAKSHERETRAAAFPPLSYSDPVRQILMLTLLAGIAFSLRSL